MRELAKTGFMSNRGRQNGKKDKEIEREREFLEREFLEREFLEIEFLEIEFLEREKEREFLTREEKKTSLKNWKRKNSPFTRSLSLSSKPPTFPQWHPSSAILWVWTGATAPSTLRTCSTTRTRPATVRRKKSFF